MPSILMIDDDRDFCEMVVRYLRDDGFRAGAVHNGNDGLHAVGAGEYDLIVLDVMMPEMGGQDVLRQLRMTPSPQQTLPVVMLTARGEETDRVIGLETGADDYVAKPCSLRELAARIRAVLRRTQAPPDEMRSRRHLVVGGLELDLVQRSASYRAKPLSLTGAEYAVLLCLARTAGRPVPKETLTKAALGREHHPADRSIDMHIANLRKKLAKLGVADIHINTLRGGGYWLVVDAER
ncbi:MAG: response regulator transcription factor [Pseudomonadota bacterium]